LPAIDAGAARPPRVPPAAAGCACRIGTAADPAGLLAAALVLSGLAGRARRRAAVAVCGRSREKIAPRLAGAYHGGAMDARITLKLLGASLLVAGMVACAGSDAQPTTPKPASGDDPPPEKPLDDTSTIDAYCNPPASVLVDGKPAGTSPVVGFKVKPGSHDVTCVDDQTGNRTMTVVLEPGDGKVVTSDRPPSAMQQHRPEKADKPK
jgi:MYXO-CTERM domain-containing protein